MFIKKLLQDIQNSKYTVKNADDLMIISRLQKGVILPNYKLMSLDITSMYPSITKHMILSSLLKENFYRQTEGICMGSVIGPKLAEIYMLNVDMILSTLNGVKFFARYVNDILIVYDSAVTTNLQILEQANKINLNIKFTQEHELNSQLSYLDVIIKRFEDHLEYCTFEKPCNTRIIFSRTTNIDERETEIGDTHKKYILNGYPKKLLNDWFHKFLRNTFKVKRRQEITKLSNMMIIRSTKKHLLEEEGVVYWIECTCSNPSFYVGETKRRLKIRLSEHLVP
ncbi:uncharacterized protein LOC111628492 isoform X2 [Centruroides sculpturatus]|uniref:uncharacterized protein LOC111628492 isoform X2 n=1 Tax=Centruroides sculpturatus TaxID=218467 RepID=UPI000C6E2AB7|nr:uncharacterized protein LOC111628492 isoform X2 [Centruroides sculpturatus]